MPGYYGHQSGLHFQNLKRAKDQSVSGAGRPYQDYAIMPAYSLSNKNRLFIAFSGPLPEKILLFIPCTAISLANNILRMYCPINYFYECSSPASGQYSFWAWQAVPSGV
jgi:hypothetical protein